MGGRTGGEGGDLEKNGLYGMFSGEFVLLYYTVMLFIALPGASFIPTCMRG